MLLNFLNSLFGELPSPLSGVPADTSSIPKADTGAGEAEHQAVTIDQNKMYKFGSEEISGSDFLQYASLGKLDRSESVQAERDNFRNEAEARAIEVAKLQAQNEMYQKQIDQLNQTEPEQVPSDLSRVFEQLTSVPTNLPQQDEYEANGGQQVVDRGFVTIEQLKAIMQAQASDYTRMLEDKFDVIPSRDELQTATQTATQEAVTQIQQVNDARQQRETTRTAKMQTRIQQLVDERGWTPQEANEYSLLREQSAQVMGTALQTDNADEYALSQEIDDKSTALMKQLDEAAAARSTQEEVDAAMTATASPREFTYEPPAEGEKPQYVSSQQRYDEATAAAHELLKRGKVLG